MGEEKINKVRVEDLPEPEKELTPEEAQRVKGGTWAGNIVLGSNNVSADAAAREQSDKKG